MTAGMEGESMKAFFSKIVTKLFLIVLSSIMVCVLIFGQISYSANKKMFQDMAGQLLLENLKQASSNLDKTLAEFENLSLRVMIDNRVGDAFFPYNGTYEDYLSKRELAYYLQEMFYLQENLVSIALLGENGKNVIVTRGGENLADKEMYNYSSLSWFREIEQKNGGVLWTAGLSGNGNESLFNSNEKNVIIMGRSLKDGITGDTAGIMLIEVDGGFLRQMLNGFIEWGQFILTDRNDRVIGYADQSKIDIVKGGSTNTIPNLIQQLSKLESPINIMNIDGVDRLLVHFHSNHTDWELIGISPLSILKQSLDRISQVTLMLALATLIISVLLSWAIGIYIGRPLKILKKVMSEGQSGNMSIVSPIVRRDEIGEVSESFNKLMESLFKLTKEREEMLVKVYKESILRKDAELKALLMQINPHFLYNTLETIEGMFYSHEYSTKIPDIVRKLGHMLRYAFKEEKEMITIGEELEQVKHYIEIIQYRFGQRLKFIVNCDKTIQKCQFVKFTLQPLIENSIRYGVEAVTGEAYIELDLVKDGDLILITLMDNGIGISPEKLEEIKRQIDNDSDLFYTTINRHGSIGIKNVLARLKMYYGNAFDFKIHSELYEGTEIILSIPYRKVDDIYDV